METLSSPEADSSRNLIVRHIEQHIGKIDLVWTELIPLKGHIDIHIVRPTAEKNYYTLVTSGMSDHTMNSPIPHGNHIELVLCLPPDWTPQNDALNQESAFWPIRLLRNLAKTPLVDGRFIWLGHTLPNEAPFKIPEPFAGTLICWALNEAESFETLNVSKEKQISFFTVFPLFQEELSHKLQYGSAKLMKRFEEQKIPMIINPKRPNIFKKPWWRMFG